MKAGDFFSFERFLTPTLIKFGYYLGGIAIIFFALTRLIATTGIYGGGTGAAIAVLVELVLALIFWRIACEGAILLFRIYERLGELKHGAADGARLRDI